MSEEKKKKWNRKADFSWDVEEHYGFVPCTDRRQIGVSYVEKGEYSYILLKDFKFYKKDGEEDWNVVKGFTIPLHAWKGINAHVQEILEEHGVEEDGD